MLKRSAEPISGVNQQIWLGPFRQRLRGGAPHGLSAAAQGRCPLHSALCQRLSLCTDHSGSDPLITTGVAAAAEGFDRGSGRVVNPRLSPVLQLRQHISRGHVCARATQKWAIQPAAVAGRESLRMLWKTDRCGETPPCPNSDLEVRIGVAAGYSRGSLTRGTRYSQNS